MNHHLTRRQFIATSAGALTVGSVLAQDNNWPSRPLRVVVPGGPGGVLDMLARALYEQLQPMLKQPIVIENRPGASGTIAAMDVIQSKPDGLTFLHASASSTVMAEALLPNLRFNVLRDLQPVALTAVGGVLLVVNPSVPAHDLPELIQLLKSQPERYPSYGSWGVGSNGHLTMEWIKQQTGIRINHVPYRTVGSELLDIVSGVTPIAWVDVVAPLSFIQQGRLRAIAINGDVRFPKLPEVKTMTEQGYPFHATGWQGVFAPKDTPMAIVERMHDEINRVLVQPNFQNTMRRLNVEPTPPVSRERFKTIYASDLKVWKQIVADGNIKVES